MKRFLLIGLAIYTLNIFAQTNLTQHVNPIIGTNGMGHTFPGACAPFGIVQLSPDTDTIPHNVDGVYQKNVYEYCAGYQHRDKTIVGFSHTHLSGTGHSDLGDILIMPTTGELKINPGTADDPDKGYRSRYSNDTEVSRPGYYEVMLDDYNIKAQLSATPRVGVHKYTFSNPEDSHLILDLIQSIYNYDGKVLWANLRVENDTLLTGYRITNGWARTNYTYFAISFSKPITNYGYTDREKVLYNGFWRKFKMNSNFPEISGRKVVAYFDFDLSNDPVLEIKCALSAVSTEGALKNLAAETGGLNFDDVVKQTHNQWEKELDLIEANGTPDQLAMLYTSLYHTMINPSIYMDVDGKYRGIDHNIHQADGFDNYTIFSLWDTYRALHPLLNILHPKRNSDMMSSLLKHYEQSVHKVLPVWSMMGNENWCMIGYHGVSLLSDAYAKGLNIDVPMSLKAMRNSSTLSYYTGIPDYIKSGYVPFDHEGSAVSITLEYAYDDWTIYQTALKTGNKELTDEYYQRALNYRNVFDRKLGFARPRYKDGSWKKDFSLLNTHGEGFIEGNSWNYSFHVPHDVYGLITAMGGDKQFINNLDSLFVMELPEHFYEHTEDVTKEGLIGNYVHGNEPSHHIPYLYAWTSQPWKSQKQIRQIMNEMYKNNIDGLCGNDDCGQMSAWYIFSAMGFYPVCPGTDQYVLGAPYLPYMKIKLGNGKIMEIKAPKVSDKNCYVKKLVLNGKPYDKLFITHNDLMSGGELIFEMSSKPNQSRGLTTETKPYSLTDGVW